MRKRSKPETVLQARIVAAIELAFPRCRVLRTNSGGVKAKRGFVHLMPKGFPDILVLIPAPWSDEGGKVVGLEVKTKKGESSNEQLDWANWFLRGGFHCSVVRTQQEALDFIARCM